MDLIHDKPQKMTNSKNLESSVGKPDSSVTLTMTNEKRKKSSNESPENSPNEFSRLRQRGKGNSPQTIDSLSFLAALDPNSATKSSGSKKAANLLKQTNIINGNEVNGNSQTIELVISDYDDDESPSTPMSNRSPGNHINSIVGTNININSQISSITHSGRSRSNSTDSRSSPNVFNSPILDSCSTQADLGRTATPTNSIGFKGHAHLNGICVLVLQMGSIPNKIPRSTIMCCDEVLEQANLGSYRKQLRKTHFLFWAVPNFTLCVGFSDSFLRIKINQADIPRFEITGRTPKNISSFPTEVSTERGLETLSLAVVKLARLRTSSTPDSTPFSPIPSSPPLSQHSMTESSTAKPSSRRSERLNPTAPPSDSLSACSEALSPSLSYLGNTGAASLLSSDSTHSDSLDDENLGEQPYSSPTIFEASTTAPLTQKVSSLPPRLG